MIILKAGNVSSSFQKHFTFLPFLIHLNSAIAAKRRFKRAAFEKILEISAETMRLFQKQNSI